MRMKTRLLFCILSLVAIFTACDKDDTKQETPAITVPDQKQLTQTVFADDTVATSNVSFTTTSAWTSKITEPLEVKSNDAKTDWVSITPSSGDKAGDYAIRITLAPNFSGEERTAAINIICDRQTITVNIKQEATTEKGDIPKPAPSGTGVLTNETTDTIVNLHGVRHEIMGPDLVRIVFIDELHKEDDKWSEIYIAEFYNPLQNGRLKSGIYNVRAINTYPYPEMKDGDCGWYKSPIAGYGKSGTIKVDINNDIYTFTFDITTDEDRETYKLTGSFNGVPEYLNEEVKVESIALDESTKTLEMGESFTLEATVFPENATNKKYTWSTSDEKVATVDGGIVSSVGKGTATITATTEDGAKTATCVVTVNPPIAVESIQVKPADITLYKGDYYTEAVITVAPENAYNKEFTWTSDNSAIAEYDGKGVRAKEAGETTITFTTKDGAKTATLKVKVNDRQTSGNGTLTVHDPSGKYEDVIHTLIEAEHTVVSKNKVSLLIKNDLGDAVMNLEFTNPLTGGRLAAGTYQIVSSESDADNTVYGGYAFISGSVVVAVDNDTYTFTIDVKNTNDMTYTGSYTGKLTYTNEYVEVSSVQLNHSEVTMMQGESYYGLSATVLPENAFNRNVKWSTDNSAVAEVTSDGYITAKAIGTAMITVTTEDGDKTATCKVTVNPLVSTGSGTFDNNKGQSITVNRAKQMLNEKQPERIEIQFFKENSPYSDLSFTIVRAGNDTGTLKTGTYSSIAELYAGELELKSEDNTGTVTVSLNGEEYTVTIDLTSYDGVKVTGTYTGKIPVD